MTDPHSQDEPPLPSDTEGSPDDPRGRLLPRAMHRRPLLFWSGLLAVLAGLAAFLPAGWLGLEGGLLDASGRLDAFSDRVATVDRRLESGESVTLAPDRAGKIRRLVGTRRLLRAGALSAGDMARLEEMLARMEREIAVESRAGSKRAVREEWLDRIVDNFPRLDRAAVDKQLARLDRQFDELARTEPADE